jgi:amino-acid N-acetyltransferase
MRVSRANETDIQELVALNNKYVAEGLTLPRTEQFAYSHLADYRVVRDADGGVVACAALDEYSPTIVELVSLAVTQDAQGLGYGKALIAAVEKLARKRGYEQLFAVSYSDELFLSCGFEHAELAKYPEKIARYAKLDRSELEVGEKHCFMKRLG